jgi:type VI secretion system FHA domain protein
MADPFAAPILQSPALDPLAFAVPTDWDAPSLPAQAPDPARPLSDAAMLDAFCAGARLDASSFAGEDPIEVMHRVGAVYQQVVLGLGELMSERNSLKSEFQMNRTTVGAAGNNPFKWAPTQSVAIDLLRTRNNAFLSGPTALRASFGDLRKHLFCLLAGSRAAVSAALEQVSPQQVEEAVKGQSLLFMSRSEACWRQFQKQHEDVVKQARENPDGEINRAFKQGYERQLQELEQLGTQS